MIGATLTAPRAPFASAVERELNRKLALWHLRGDAARQAGERRQMPSLRPTTRPEHVALIEAAWFAGFDGR